MEVHHVTEEAETFTCNAFLAVGEETTLVDAGAWDGVVDEIRSHVDAVDAVVMTHQHGDHVAQLEAVVDAFDPDVYAYDDHPTRTHELGDGDTVTIGDESFDVVYTPGHADDHVSFVSDSSLFSGDVVVHDDGAFDYGSFGRTDMAGQSRERLIESIQELLERMPDGGRASREGRSPSDRSSGLRGGEIASNGTASPSPGPREDDASAASGDERSESAGVEHMYAGHGGVFHGDVRDVVETALERAEKRKPKYPDG